MNICKTKITMSICAESSTDAVAKLRANGMGFNAACKLVADEYNTTNKNEDNFEAVKWQSLKRRCIRLDNSLKDDQSGDSVTSTQASGDSVTSTQVPTEGVLTEPVILDVPIVTPKVQDDIDKLKETCAKLRSKNTLLQQQVKELQALLLEYDTTPVVKSEQEQRDEFISAARKAKEEKAIAERRYFGVKEDGTPI